MSTGPTTTPTGTTAGTTGTTTATTAPATKVPTARSIVAGTDGSGCSGTVLRHAAAQAALRGLPVTVVHAWQAYPVYEGLVLPQEEIRSAEAEVLEEAVRDFQALAPGTSVRSALLQARPETALLEASEHADLVVVGRHSGSSAWLGPVLGHLTARAHCPVLVVPAGASADPGPVVVGVDDSPASTEAIGFAFDQAGRWQVPLVAVLAVPPTFDAYLPSAELLDELRASGRRYQAEALAGWSEKYPDVEVRHVVSLDGALPALLHAAEGAAMTVVGSHGRGALRRVALGSVSGSLLRAATGPVVVVRPHDQA